jgi:hypothetical protein
LFELRQELSDQLLLALFDASSVAAELQVWEGGAEALEPALGEVQNDATTTYCHCPSFRCDGHVLPGIFLFGSFEVLAGQVLAGAADMVGNILQGSYGYAALDGQQQYQLLQPRNLMQEVWEWPEYSTLYPESVWRFLNWPQDDGRLRSRREPIVQDSEKRLGEPGSAKDNGRRQLFFGKGGIYTVPELRHQAEMLDRLKTSARLMSQDLNLLFKETLGYLSGTARPTSGRSLLID